MMRVGQICFLATSVMVLASLIPATSTAQQITAGGVQCGASNFSFTELSPSRFGANETRLARLRELDTYAQALLGPDAAPGSGAGSEPLCNKQLWLPGCDGVERWRNARNTRWPTKPDVYYIQARARLLELDDQMEIEAKRALAHSACRSASLLLASSPIPAECLKLVSAEASADPRIEVQLSALVHSLTSSEPGNGTRYRFGINGFSDLDAALKRLAPQEPIDPQKAELDAQNPKQKAQNPKQKTQKESETTALTEDAESTIRAYGFYKFALDWQRNPCKPSETGPAKAGSSCNVSYPDTAIVSMSSTCSTIRSELYCTSPPLPSQADPWVPPSSEVGRAASKVTVVRPAIRQNAIAPQGSEEESLLRNYVACQNAMFYVSPTRELVRHTVDNVVGEYVTVCVDTSGFAVDEPVQATITTPAAQSVFWLWPGEPLRIPLEISTGTAQVAHLTFSGYPRREVLRAMARHEGGPLAPTATSPNDVFDLVASAATIQNDKDAAKETAGIVKVLQGFLTSVPKDKDFITDQSALGDVLGMLALPDSGGGKVTSDALRSAASKVFEDVKRLETRDQNLSRTPSARKAVDDLVKAIPDLGTKLSVADLKAPATDIAQFSSNLKSKIDALQTSTQAPTDKAAKLALAAAEMCQITSEVVPLVTDDILVRSADETKQRDTYIVEYDFGGGVQTNQTRPITDDDQLFAVVRNVLPGWSVGMAIGDHSIVQRNIGLVGTSSSVASDFPFSDKTNQSRPGFKESHPLDLEMQPASTQILALGHLPGGTRFDLTVCASNATNDDCFAAQLGQAGAPTHRTIAKNTIIVHSYHYLGLRAGFGVADTDGTQRELVTVPGIAGSVVRERTSVSSVALPLLLAAYPWGRDSTEMPKRISPGVVAGIEATKVSATPRFYYGIVVDFWGLGATLGGFEERASTFDNPNGSVLPAGAARPDNIWLPGVFVAVTTDLDIFQAAFQKYLNAPQFPTLAGSN